jgi:hypothetical protein
VPEDAEITSNKYEIEKGYHAFIFKTENYSNDVIVIARYISFNTDTGYYYDRADLKENERLHNKKGN